MNDSLPQDTPGPNPSHDRRQVVVGDDLIRDGSLSVRKLKGAFKDSLPPLPTPPQDGEPSEPDPADQTPQGPAYHGESYKEKSEVGTPEANEEPTLARGTHHHEYTSVNLGLIQSNPDGDTELNEDVISEVNAAPAPEVGYGGSSPESWRCVTWEYEGGAFTPFHIWAQYSADGGTTWGEPKHIGVAKPGDRQFLYRASGLNFTDPDVMDRYVIHAINHKVGAAFKVPQAGYDGKLDIDWLPGEVATDTEVAAAIAVETARATAAEVAEASARATADATLASADATEAATRAAADALRLLASANLSDVANAATSRTNLGLGTAATKDSDTDVTLAANSDSSVPTQKATKAYADAVSAAASVYFPAGILPKTANYTVVAGDKGKLVVVTPAAVTTITLPTAPADAFAVGVLAANTGSPVKIAVGGADAFSGNLNGTTTLYTMAARECLWLVYESATSLWRVMSWAPQAAGTGTYGAAKVASAGTAGAALSATDPTTTDARTPTAHASSHDSGGSDALAADAAAGTPSLRRLGTTSVKACAGDDSRLSDSRSPTGTAGGVLGGTYPNPTFASGVYTPNFLYKSSDQTLIGSSFTDVSSLTFAVAASKSYFFEFFVIIDADATTTGIDIAVNGPTIGSGTINYEQQSWTSATVKSAVQATAYDNNTANASSNGTTKRIFKVWGILVNGANAGTLACRVKREAVGTGPNVRAGSWGRWALLN